MLVSVAFFPFFSMALTILEKKISYKFLSLNIVFVFFWKKDIKKKFILLTVKLDSLAVKI